MPEKNNNSTLNIINCLIPVYQSNDITEKKASYYINRKYGKGQFNYSPDYCFRIKNSKYIFIEWLRDTDIEDRYDDIIKILENERESDFYFIVANKDFLNIGIDLYSKFGFGILYEDVSGIWLIRKAFRLKRYPESPNNIQRKRLPDWLIDRISGLRRIKGAFAKELVKFAKSYSGLDYYNEDNQYKLIEYTIKLLSQIDNKYICPTAMINNLFVSQHIHESVGDTIAGRDNYFHSFYIFLIGMIIIDSFKSDFMDYLRNYFLDENDDIEYIWLLTSMFHDASKKAIDKEYLREITGGDVDITYPKNNTSYNVAVKNISDALEIIKVYPPPEDNYEADTLDRDHIHETILKDSFAKTHGVHGAIRLLGEIIHKQRFNPNKENDKFLLRHVVVASISIILHDGDFRKYYAKGLIGRSVKISQAPFGALLLYLDSLQEDGRFSGLPTYQPDIVKEVAISENIELMLDRTAVENRENYEDMKKECSEVNRFFDRNEMSVIYPPYLLE